MERGISFSVVIAVYKNDDAGCFDLALKSIIVDQTMRPNEVVLVVDGPVSEDINKVIHKYERLFAGLRVLRLPENKGLGNALRRAVGESSNDLIAHMDSDDIALPNRFEQQLKVFEKESGVDIVGGDIVEFIDVPANVISRRSVPCTNEEIRDNMKHRCAMNHVTVMYRKEAVLSAGNYQEWFCNEDYYLWIRMLEKDCVFANTGTVLVYVRVGADMYSRRGGKQYFESEKGIQKYMLERHIIGKRIYAINVLKRWIVQMLLPNSLRAFVYRKFARE